MLDEIRIALRCTHFSFVRFGALLTLSKNEPHQQISGIVSCGIASGAVVIGSSAIESRIPSVLDREIDVLLRPPRKIEQVSIALRTAIRAARNRSLGKQQWVGRSGHIKVADRARKTRAEMIFNISLHSVEVVAGHSGSALSKARPATSSREYTSPGTTEHHSSIAGWFGRIGNRRPNQCSRPLSR